MRLGLLLVGLTILGLTGLAHADLYKYRDNAGRMHITNDILSIPLEYRQQALQGSEAETTPPAPTITPEPATEPAPSAPPAPSPSAAVPPQPSDTPAPAAPATPHAEHVDTTQYRFITPGMSEAEVTRRLGPPLQVVELPKARQYGKLLNGWYGSIELIRTRWDYPGWQGVPATSIVFENGRVLAKLRR